MPFQMPARLLPACRACFRVSFLGLNVEIHGGVVEYRPLKKVEILDFRLPCGPRRLKYLTMSNTSDFTLFKKNTAIYKKS